jgi:serine/threonine protein kinase
MSLLVCDHPAPDRLRAFALGRLSAEQSGPIEQHVEECIHCCQLLRSVADDSLVETLRGAERAVAAETVGFGDDASTESSPTVPAELQDHPRYRIDARLGMGGMGVVYRAEHRLMQRPVALKVIHPRLVERPEAVARFRQEVQAAARLNDEHVVRAYDAEHVGAIHFLVMEYVDGESVDRIIAREGRLPIAKACDCARQAALGLAAAHAQGMAHRDIKPQNLIIDTNGCVKVLDFGLARFVLEQHTEPAARLTSAHLVLGTPDYMAPEQARESRAADIRSDIYSLGCTLYHMLAGQPPYPDGSVIEKLSLHISGRPQSLEELRPGVPDGLLDVIHRMMAPQPTARYPSPAAVAEALEPFTRALPSLEHTVSPLERLPAITPALAPIRAKPARSKPRRDRTALVAVACALLLAAVGITAAAWLGSRQSVPDASDSFAGDRLSKRWTILQPQSGKVTVEKGALVLIPDANTGWYQAGHGMLLYEEIKGDFVATARLSAKSLSNPSGPPTRQFNSAGLVARDPNSTPTTEMWIMISLGQQGSFPGTKTEPTCHSHSQPTFQPTSTMAGELRLARIGTKFSLLRRLDGEQEWRLLKEHQFPEVPDVLQVGPAVNAYQAADIRATFDSVRIDVPTSASDLYRD